LIFKKRNICLNSRRGVSSIVGAMIFTVLLVGGFSALSLALNTQTDIVKTHISVAEMDLKKQQENFDVSVSTNPSNFLQVFVDNKGQNPVEISDLLIINKTAPTKYVGHFSMNSKDAIVTPGSAPTDILLTQPLIIIPDTYDIKVVSSLGTIKTRELITGTPTGVLRAKLVTNPPDVIIGQNVTISMLVTNTYSKTVENVVPHPGIEPPQVVGSSPPTPSSIDLGAGESALFSWKYRLDGTGGTPVGFSGYASGNFLGGPTFNSNTSTDFTTLQVDETGSGSGGGGNPDPLSDELLARPQLFLVIPGPQGDSNTQALWGVNIVNPVDVPMTVSKLTITAFAPGANNNDKIFNSPCSASSLIPSTNIYPTGGNYWTCPSENLLMWENFASPITIPPFTTQPFLVRVTPGAIAGLNHLESIVVQASVFTNVGAFGKTGYQTTMYDGSDSIGSIYLSDTQDSRNNNEMHTTRTGIPPNTQETFNVVFADLDTDNSTYIKSGAKLVINIPKDWTGVNLVSYPGFVDPPTVTVHGDGSTQIIGVTAGNLGTATNVADTITFTAVSPAVTTDQLFVMYLLAEGETETGANDFALGALSEVVLVVDVP